MNWFFWIIYLVVIGQRIIELRIARRNERYLRAQGAHGYGAKHYPWIVLMHCLFLVSMLGEILFGDRDPASWFWIPLTLFILAQILRVWAIRSLGPFWNTKVLVLPMAEIGVNGPYRFIRHPNYTVVSLELLTLPLIFQAYVTAAVFTVLNAILLSIRIPLEEEALRHQTNYAEAMDHLPRFVPAKRK